MKITILEQMMKILEKLDKYNGKNEEDIINEILADDTTNKSYVLTRFSKNTSKILMLFYSKKRYSLRDEIAFYENKIAEYNQIVNNAKAREWSNQLSI